MILWSIFDRQCTNYCWKTCVND